MAKKAVKKTARKKSAPGKSQKPKADAARRKAAPKPPATAVNAAYKVPGKEYFNQLVKRLDSLGDNASSAAGLIADAIDLAHEQKGLDKKALAIFRGLNRLPIARLQTTLPHLMLYIEYGNLEKKAASQGQLAVTHDPDQKDIEDAIADADRPESKRKPRNKDNTPKGSQPVAEGLKPLSEAAKRAIERADLANKPPGSPEERRGGMRIVDAPSTEPLDTSDGDDKGPPEPNAKSVAM